MTALPENIFQRIVDSIRRIYGRATGRTELPQDVQDAFNSFFWSNDSAAKPVAETERVMAQPMQEGFEQRKKGYENRIRKWLNSESIRKAQGKSDREIALEFGTELLPIGEVPIEAMDFFGLDDSHVYSSESYFLDHAVNHHSELEQSDYMKMVDTLSDFDYVAIQNREGVQNLVFVKKYDDKWYRAIVGKDRDTGKAILYLSYFKSNKQPEVKSDRLKIQEPAVFVTHPASAAIEPSAVDISGLADSSTQNVSSDPESVNEEDIRTQRALGEDAVDQGQRKYIHMDDERFKRSVEKDVFLPDYVVKAKLESEDETMVETARQELDDRDKSSLQSS